MEPYAAYLPISWPWLGHSIEAASFLIFGWCAWDLRRQGRGEHIELFIAFVYGWLLEIFDMWIFGSYHYGPATWAWLGPVPVYIPLLWATIIHSSMAISDRVGLPAWARPWMDGLLAVLIDLAVDAIAIRVGLWHWKIPLNEGWFGVPAGNLYAWIWVAFWYSFTMRLVRERITRRKDPAWHRFLVPVAAYVGLLTTLIGAGWLNIVLGWESPNQRLRLFAVHVVVFCVIVWIAFASNNHRGENQLGAVPFSLRANRWLIHVSFFAILLASGIGFAVPLLIVVSLASIIVEAVVHAQKV